MDFNFTQMSGSMAIIYFAAVFIVHFAIALAVVKDIHELKFHGLKPFFGGEILWFLVTITGGIFVALAYWIMHHSSLRSPRPPWQRESITNSPNTSPNQESRS